MNSQDSVEAMFTHAEAHLTARVTPTTGAQPLQTVAYETDSWVQYILQMILWYDDALVAVGYHSYICGSTSQEEIAKMT